MKKNIILIILIFIISSCGIYNNTEDTNNIVIKNDKINIEKNDDVFGGKLEEVREKDLEEINKKSIISLNDSEKMEELKYKEIKNYNKINISKINEKFILENSLDKKEIFIDLGFSNDRKKMNKIINLIKNISEKNEIKIFRLHCNDLNFNNQEIKILRNLKVNLLSLDSNCGFKKEKFNKNWYNEEKVVNFLKETKKISEIHIGHIDEDYFRKKDGFIEKSDRIFENNKWEKM